MIVKFLIFSVNDLFSALSENRDYVQVHVFVLRSTASQFSTHNHAFA